MFLVKFLGKVKDFFYRKIKGMDRRLQVREKGTQYRLPLQIDNLEGLNLGKKVYLGPHCHFDALGGIEICDFTIIGPHVKIWSYNHDFKSKIIPYGPSIIYKPVKIERGVWVGVGVTILPGTFIGEGVIIGGGAVVSGNVPPFSIVRAANASIEKLDVIKEFENFYMDRKDTFTH